MNKPQNYVVLIQHDTGRFTLIGPYQSFKRAEADAKAWQGIDGNNTSVEPLQHKTP